jgi:hypothetical protein
MNSKNLLKVRAGMTTVHTALGLGILLGVVGICYLLISHQSGESQSTTVSTLAKSPAAESGAVIESVNNNTVTDLSGLNIDDKVGSMTVVSRTDIGVGFSGQVTVSGKYHYYDSGELNGKVCLDMDGTDSYKQLPANKGDDRYLTLCFYSDTKYNEFGEKGSTGSATVIIDNYAAYYPGTSDLPNASLVKILKITRDM